PRMTSERTDNIGNTFPAFGLSIGVGFRSVCLRAMPRNIVCFQYFGSDYPIVSSVVDCRHLGLFESVLLVLCTLVSRARSSTRCLLSSLKGDRFCQADTGWASKLVRLGMPGRLPRMLLQNKSMTIKRGK